MALDRHTEETSVALWPGMDFVGQRRSLNFFGVSCTFYAKLGWKTVG